MIGKNYLEDKFHAWFERVGAQGSWYSFYQEIEAKYQAPARHYHTFHGHIDFCIHELYRIPRASIENIDILELSMVLHDVEMDFSGNHNEEDSANFSENICQKMGLPKDFARRSAMHIRHTDHKGKPLDCDSRLAMDIDLAIFGQDQFTFDRYERLIRQEYAIVPEIVFRTKRAEILQNFLDRPSIFITDYFQKKYETLARKNLKNSISHLRR